MDNYEKKYKEALERAKRWAEGTLSPERTTSKGVCETIFPELAESEDERMMREFNDWLCEEIECHTNDLRDEKDRRTLNMLCYILTKVKDWLEKQKETEKEVSELFDCTDSYNKGYRAGQEKALQELKNHIKEDKTQCYAYDAGYASGFIVGKEQGWKERGKYEKQKEHPKSADSIPSDCVSNAKCENRWYKVGDFLPDNGRDVLAKDALSNYLIAHYDGDQWFISGYDNEDKPIVYTPAIKEWCNIPSEKQKEQKLDSITKHIYGKDDITFIRDCANILIGNDFPTYAERLLSMFEQKEQKPAEWKPTEEQFNYLAKAIMTLGEEGDCKTAGVLSEIRKGLKCSFPDWKVSPDYPEEGCNVSLNGEVKKIQEWSEEDEKMKERLITRLNWITYNTRTDGTSPNITFFDEIDWLKSLRPQSQGTYKQIIHNIYNMLKDKDFFEIRPPHLVSLLNDIRVKCKDADECATILDEPSWKPSKEQMDSLRDTIVQTKGYSYSVYLPELYEQLKKLM